MAAFGSYTPGSTRLSFGIAVLLHIVLIVILSLRWSTGDSGTRNPPVAVELIADTLADNEALALAKLGDEKTRPEPPEPAEIPEPAEPPEPAEDTAQTESQKKQTTQVVVTESAKMDSQAEPQSKPEQEAKPERVMPRPTGRLDGIASGISKTVEAARPPSGSDPSAQPTLADVETSIDISIKAAVRARWSRCIISGVDVDLLVTTVRFRLSLSGELQSFTSVTTKGRNNSNQFQVQRHQECAKRAIELSAPFDLPLNNYGFWQNYTLDFVKKR